MEKDNWQIIVLKYYIQIFYIFFSCLTFEVIAQSYNDGPIEMQVKLREVQGNFAATDEA